MQLQMALPLDMGGEAREGRIIFFLRYLADTLPSFLCCWPKIFKLENKFCLHFKIRSVFIQVVHQKWKKTHFLYLVLKKFEKMPGENDAYVIYCFIEGGNHTSLIIWQYFW